MTNDELKEALFDGRPLSITELYINVFRLSFIEIRKVSSIFQRSC